MLTTRHCRHVALDGGPGTDWGVWRLEAARDRRDLALVEKPAPWSRGSMEPPQHGSGAADQGGLLRPRSEEQ